MWSFSVSLGRAICLAALVALAQGLKLSELLPASPSKNYDRLQVPLNNSAPARVKLHLSILGLDSFDEQSMTYSADVFFSQSWFDPRLRIPANLSTRSEFVSLDVAWVEQLWVPDLFFKNAKDATLQSVTVPNHFLWLYQDGTLLYMMKLYLTLGCNMDLRAHPHDKQKCNMQIESLSRQDSELQLQWDSEVPLKVDLEDIALPSLLLEGAHTANCTKPGSAGSFSCLEVIFSLSRGLAYHVFYTYTPAVLLVILSWLQLWTAPESALPRLALGSTCVLAAAAVTAMTRLAAPRVLYLTAGQIFAALCLGFTFLALAESFLVVCFLNDSYTKGSGSLSWAQKVDLAARISLPCLFVAFNVIYWIVVAAL